MLGLFSPHVFLGAAQRRLLARGVPVFTYHKIGRPAARTRDPFLHTAPEQFEAQLARLHRAGFRAASLSALTLPASRADSRMMVTFDDGFESVLRHGLPILKQRGVTAIQFIVAGLIGKRNEWDIVKGDAPERLMDVAQIREWLAAGQEIGSHSVTHRNLKKLSVAEAREEISGSKMRLEDLFGIEVRHFSYPFGGCPAPVRDLVEEAGYQTACGVEFGVNDTRADRFRLRRIIPHSSWELVRKTVHRLGRKLRS